MKLVHTPGPKMIQSDTLSCQPDFIPEKDTDNEDIIMLPENLFINLIDLNLQWWIANTRDLDADAMEALTILLEQGPATLQWELGDWTIEKFEGWDILFFRGKNYIPKDDQQDIMRMFHDHDIPENSKPTMLSDSTTGGQVYKLSSKTTCRDVESVNNLKLTDPWQNQLLFPLKAHTPLNPLQIVPWI